MSATPEVKPCGRCGDTDRHDDQGDSVCSTCGFTRWAVDELPRLEATVANDPVKIGDIYDVKSGAYFYVVMSEPYADGRVLAEEHWPDTGFVGPVVIDPANPAFIKRPKRPPFPKRDYRIGMDATGAVGYPIHVVHIPADEVDGLPWRWADGTLVTDDEKANRAAVEALRDERAAS